METYKFKKQISSNIFEKCYYYEKPNSKIESTFNTLIMKKGDKNHYTWYKEVGIDKGYASRIKRGLIIPHIFLMIAIANYFEVDTAVIWGNLPFEDYMNIINSFREVKK